MAVAKTVPPSAQADEFISAKLTGKVMDATGHAIAGAKVQINRITGAKVDSSNIPQWSTLTDQAGQYELTLRFIKGQTAVVREVFADSPGFVRSAPPLQLSLKGGESHELPFTLEKGEVLAGMVRVPLRDFERAGAKKTGEIKRLVEVSGPKLDHLLLNARVHQTGPGGRFETWVPPGEYTLRLLAYNREPVEWTGIKSGRSDIVLELPEFTWSEASVGKVFDQLWETMDRHYSYFFLKPDVDWNAAKEKSRPIAVRAKNAKELTVVLKEMLAPLRDLHVWIQTPDGIVSTFAGGYSFNGNGRITRDAIEEIARCGKFAIVGKSKADGFGYFLMLNQNAATSELVRQAVEAMQKLRDVPGFIVDLRTANGGSEPFAQEIASLFCVKDTVYAKQKYRNGASHEAFTPATERTLKASTNPYTRPVICILGPGAVSSGEGFAKMMKALPQVTTVGMPTRGASGNPKPFPLEGTGLSVMFSRWVDLLPDGQPIEGKGVTPDVTVDLPASAYSERDPTLEKAVECLRQKVAASTK